MERNRRPSFRSRFSPSRRSDRAAKPRRGLRRFLFSDRQSNGVLESVLDAFRGGSGKVEYAALGRSLRVEGLEDRRMLAVNVAVLDTPSNAGITAIVAQLNDDTFHDFTASIKSAADLDELAELNLYDVVILGNDGSGAAGDSFSGLDSAVLRAWVEAGGGLVTTGWALFGMPDESASTKTDLDAIIPVGVIGNTYIDTGAGSKVDINVVVHPVTAGVADFSFAAPTYGEAPSLGADGGATVLATYDGGGAHGKAAVVAGSIVSGRSVYLGPIYAGQTPPYDTTPFRTGDPDRLLEQAVYWAGTSGITTVVPAAVPTAADNDYTRIMNAVKTAADGDTIILDGTFDWTEANAAASWALGNDGLPATSDDYSIQVPAGLENVTLTAISGLGSATIQGPGDLATVNLESFIEFNGNATDADNNQGWTISDLRILDFDLSIAMFSPAGDVSLDAYDNTKITGNYIRIANDLNSVVAPVDTNQNIGIHYAVGDGQTISNNTIDIPGDGISHPSADLATNRAAFSSVVGMQSNTHGAAYHNLLIDGNTVNVLNAQNAANPQRIIGIWENGNSIGNSKITVSNNSFNNLAAGNDPTLNLQQAFWVTSHSVTETVTYSGNKVSGASVGIKWVGDPEFAAQNYAGLGPVEIIGNELLNVETGILVQNNGSAHLSDNTLTNSGAMVDIGTGVQVLAGSIVTIDNTGGGDDTITGFAIGVEAKGKVTLADATISGGLVGVSVNGGKLDMSSTIIQGVQSFGVQVSNLGDADIDASEISGTATSPAAVLSSSGNADVTGSILSGSLRGLLVVPTGTGSVHGSNLEGVALLGVENLTGAVIDASGNWWGTNVDSGVLAKTLGKVDFTPYLHSNADSNAGVGFDGDVSHLHVTALGQQIGVVGRIQEGINEVADDVFTGKNRIVDVSAGTYAEPVNVNKSLKLQGAQTGVDARGRVAAESIITTPLADELVAILTISSKDVTVDGFTVDGDGPQVGGVLLQGGVVSSNARRGIAVDGDNSSVVNNRVRNLYGRGLQYWVLAGTPPLGGLANKNEFDTIGAQVVTPANSGDAIVSFSADPTITDNKVTNAVTGITIMQVYPPNVTPIVISGNDINAINGIAINETNSGLPPITINSNTVKTSNGGIGLLLWTVDGDLTATGNTFTGTGVGDIGVYAWDGTLNDAMDVKIIGGSITGYDTGVHLTNNEGFGPFGPALNDATITLDNVTITGGSKGVFVEDAGKPESVHVNVTNDTTIDTNNGIGILVSGPNASADVADNDNSITGNLVGIKVDGGGSASITGNTISLNTTGVLVSNGDADIANNFIHDNAAVGVHVAVAGTATVEKNSFDGNAIGLQNDSAITIDAEFNWWGEIHGPTRSPENPWDFYTALATGDPVIGKVDFTAWLTSGVDSAVGTPGFQPAAMDMVAPAAPTTPDLDPASDTGVSDSDDLTNDNTPTFKGTAEADSLVLVGKWVDTGLNPGVVDDSEVTFIGAGVADGSGNYLVTLPTLPDGTHQIVARAIDQAGNPGAWSGALAVTIDSTIAATTIDLETASDSDSPNTLPPGTNTDNITNINTPTFSGTADPNATVDLFDGVTLIGSTVASGGGAWSITLGVALTDGVHSITAKATDNVNNISVSPALLVTIDTFVSVNTTPDMTAATDSGINNDNITNDNTPTFTGTSEAAGDYIELLVDGVSVAVNPSPGPGIGGNSGGGGVWTVTPIAAIPNGAHVIQTRVTDIAGNVSVSSGLNIVIDTIATTVTAVRVGSTAWDPNFKQVADPTALDLGYLIPGGAAQLDVLPWTNINQIMLTFSEPTVTSLGDLRLRGVNTASYDALITGFSYDPGTLTATWTLSSALTKDRYLISLNDTATDIAGSALDGEWVNGADTFPSGNGVAGTDFNFNVNILPGDASRNGFVQSGDVTQIQNQVFQSTLGGVSTPGYSIFFDLNGNRFIQSNDVTLAQNRVFDTLPIGSPALPPLVAGFSASSEMAQAVRTAVSRPVFRPTVRQPIVVETVSRPGLAARDAALEKLDSDGGVSSQWTSGNESAVSGSAIDAALGSL